MPGKHPRVAETVEDYLRYRASTKAKTTVEQEAYVLRRLVAWLGRDIQIRSLTEERVADWFYGPDGLLSEHTTRDGLVRPPIQSSTYNFYRLRLASFFRYCTKRGLTRLDLLSLVDPKIVPRKERLQPSPDVLFAMLESRESPRDRAVLAVAMNTGLRTSEIRAMRVGDVDLSAGTMRVIIRKSRDWDDMPVTRELDDELRLWFKAYGLALARPLRPEDFLLPAKKAAVFKYYVEEDGSRRRERTAVGWDPSRPVAHAHEVVQEALADQGLPTTHEGIHTIRRAVARAYFDSLVAQGGYDGALRMTMALLHHKNSATTEVYLGLSSERMRRDEHLRGKPFLSSMRSATKVVRLDDRRGG